MVGKRFLTKDKIIVKGTKMFRLGALLGAFGWVLKSQKILSWNVYQNFRFIILQAEKALNPIS